MGESLSAVFYIPDLLGVVVSLLICAVLLTPLEYLFPAVEQPIFTRKGVALDLMYWFLTPLLTRIITSIGVLLLLFLLFGGAPLDRTVLDGFGPIGRQPLWVQSCEILLLADFIDYWTHRLFHKTSLWRFHAVHHSSEEMSWLSSARMHPVNDLITRVCQIVPLALFGFAGKAVIFLAPYLSLYVMFVHSNISWNFGPFRYLVVSPAFHRWHHSSENEGLDKNFSGIFPLWDVLFKTAYLPRHMPKRYGVRGAPLPNTLLAQLSYPFQKHEFESSTKDEGRP